jgi:hypothetical protein
MSDLYEPLEFVFCGFRKGDAGLFISVATLRDGVLGREMYFSKGKSKRRWVVGGIYSGASFSDNGAKVLDDAHYVKAWEVQGDKIEWQAKSEQAEALARSEKLEADDRKRNELEELMLPIRKQYGALTKRRDRAGAAALEEAVLRALRAPIRKAEEK